MDTDRSKHLMLVALRVIRAYRTVSFHSALALARMPPVDLLARASYKRYARKYEDRSPESRTDEIDSILGPWEREWSSGEAGSWTRRLLPPLSTWMAGAKEMEYHQAQMRTGHGC